jgi:hypothetical protein
MIFTLEEIKKCPLLSNPAETKHDDDAEGPFFPCAKGIFQGGVLAT